MKTRFALGWSVLWQTPPLREPHPQRDLHPGHCAHHLAAVVAALLVFHGSTALAATCYVWQGSPSPSWPYATWATAAHVIQEAVDAAVARDEIVVTNGLYATGGRAVYGQMTNRVAIDEPVMVRSVNGPELTIIQGYQLPGTTNGDGAIRCVYLANGAVLSGFTLTNGATRSSGDYTRERSGGGLWCESAAAVATNCVVTGNSASSYGGGAYSCTLRNCTLTGNSASYYGGGAYEGTLYNCIVYYNWARFSGPNYSGSTLNYCCTTPLAGSGVGNITNEPALASALHLSASSPCRGAGSAAYASGADIDGEAWLDPPSMGCDEYVAGGVSGPLEVAISIPWTNVAVRFRLELTALISGRASASGWSFGDGEILSDRLWASHSWASAGDYPVVLTAWNESNPGGVSATVTVRVVEVPVHYVAVNSAAPAFPHTNWATAARTIQETVDAASAVPGSLVLVSNGVYATGGRAVYGQMTNRVAIDKPVMVRSVNGPELTIIQGYQVPGTTNGDGPIRCVYLTNGAVLSGFTLTNGATRSSGGDTREGSGGGLWCESAAAVATNCTLKGNSAFYYGGGGALGGTLYNCTLTGNSASSYGGGAAWSTLYNCTLTGNSATSRGGGAYGGTLYNCIVYYNWAGFSGPNYSSESTLNYCCTTPLASGVGNITSAPVFVDTNGWSNLRLQNSSPCINSGNNANASINTDLDGHPRIVGGTVDMGAYEFQSPASIISYAWLQEYGLPTDGSADFVDLDGDLLTTWQEWQADSDPTNGLSVPQIESISAGPPVTVQFSSSSDRLYTLCFAPKLTNALWIDLPGQTDVRGSGGLQSLSDTNVVPTGFYRVSVRRP